MPYRGAANKRFYFRYNDRTISLLPKSVIAFFGLKVQFVLDLVRNPEDRFPQDAAHNNMVFQKKEHNNSLVSITYTSFVYCRELAPSIVKFL